MWGPGFGRRRAWRRGFRRGYWAGRMGPGPWMPMRPFGRGFGCAPLGCLLPLLFLLFMGMLMMFSMARW